MIDRHKSIQELKKLVIQMDEETTRAFLLIEVKKGSFDVNMVHMTDHVTDLFYMKSFVDCITMRQTENQLTPK